MKTPNMVQPNYTTISCSFIIKVIKQEPNEHVRAQATCERISPNCLYVRHENKHKGITQEDAGENLHLEKATSELEKH
jgi:hypothetical protein